MSKLNKEQISDLLSELTEWAIEDNSITKQYVFRDFIQAMSFVNAVALEAEKIDHHPDILIFGWNKVKINISTHSQGGITEKDFALAKKIEERKK